jgi:hypothetical protein
MGKTAGGFFSWLSRPAKGAIATKPAKAGAPAPAHSQQFLNSQSSQAATNSTHAIRKDLLRMVLRETLSRNGIPVAWIGADMLRSTGRGGRDVGIHVRLLIHHWDPRLLVHGVAFEQNFHKRILAMDPLATNWLMGISWQYAMEDQSHCPALPHPGSWTAMPHEHQGPAPAFQHSSDGDVIAGPVTIQKSSDGVKADLDRMLSMRDNEKRKAEEFAATQPIQL